MLRSSDVRESASSGDIDVNALPTLLKGIALYDRETYTRAYNMDVHQASQQPSTSQITTSYKVNVRDRSLKAHCKYFTGTSERVATSTRRWRRARHAHRSRGVRLKRFATAGFAKPGTAQENCQRRQATKGTVAPQKGHGE